MASRRFDDMHACYLNLTGLADLTTFLQLPQPGPLHICCYCADTLTGTGMEALLAATRDKYDSPNVLHILPARKYRDSDLFDVQQYCAATGQKVIFCRNSDFDSALWWFDGETPPQSMPWNILHGVGSTSFPSFDCGPARLHIVPFKALYHPEMVLASAKQGCDLVIIFSDSFAESVRLLGGARTLDNVATTICSPKGGGIWMTPEGHQRWEEVVAGPGRSCSFLLDTNRTRKKRFQDRIDFDTLLHRAVG